MLYFAYGSNLSKAAMRQRAPLAQPLISALLPNYRLAFESNEPHGTPDAFFANVRAGDLSVPGAVYALDARELDMLDSYEDLARGVYERVCLRVRCADGKVREANVYRMPARGRPMRPGMPSRVQLRQIRQGYADWGLDLRVLGAALASASARIA